MALWKSQVFGKYRHQSSRTKLLKCTSIGLFSYVYGLSQCPNRQSTRVSMSFRRR